MAGMNLGKQYGPLPLGGWIAVIIGGLGIGYFINRSQGSGAEEPEDEELTGGESSGAGGGQFIYDPPTGIQTPSTDITDNLTWAKRAKDYLTGLPGVDAVTAANAIERYLSGMKLSTAERALVNLAIAAFGNPPEGVTPVDDVPPTVPKPPTKPPTKPDAPKPIPKPRPTPTPKKIYAISIKQRPSTVRRGQAATFGGDLSVSTGGKAKPVSALILVERRKPNSSTWLPHTVDGSNSAGHWGVQVVFGSPGTWGFRVRHSPSGKVASTSIRVT